MADKLFASYFEEGVDISDKNNLLKIAEEIGIDKDKIQDELKQNNYGDEVLRDQKMAGEIGINSVPFFVINDKYTISGAQSIEYFKMILETANNS